VVGCFFLEWAAVRVLDICIKNSAPQLALYVSFSSPIFASIWFSNPSFIELSPQSDAWPRFFI